MPRSAPMNRIKCCILWCHDLPKRTYENTETDFYGYRNGPERTSGYRNEPEQTSAQTETNFNGNQER